MALERVVQAHELQSLSRALLDHRAQPHNTLIPPVPEQLRVERAHEQPATRQRPIREAVFAQPCQRAPTKSAACSRASATPARERMPRPRCSTGCGGGRCDGGSRDRRRRWIAALAPHQRHRAAVDRHEQHPGVGHHGLRCSAAPSPKRSVSSTQWLARRRASSSRRARKRTRTRAARSLPPRVAETARDGPRHR